jgi:hypothetical protein
VAGALDRNSPLDINNALFERIACPSGEPGCASPGAAKTALPTADECRDNANRDQADADGDGTGDACGPPTRTSIRAVRGWLSC